MRRALAALVMLPGLGYGATAGSVDAPAALPLAAIIGQYEPKLPPGQKAALATLLDGRVVSEPGTIRVEADAIVCEASDVDVIARSCALTFGTRTIMVTGRQAHEIFATLVEAGVPSEGAAGTLHEDLRELGCAISASQIAAKAGGGATCMFKPGR